MNLKINVNKMPREQLNALAIIAGIPEPEKLPNLEAVKAALEEKAVPETPAPPPTDPRQTRLEWFRLGAHDRNIGHANFREPEESRDEALYHAYKADCCAVKQQVKDAGLPETKLQAAWYYTRKGVDGAAVVGGAGAFGLGAKWVIEKVFKLGRFAV